MYKKSEHVSIFVGERENLNVSLQTTGNLTLTFLVSPLSIRVSVREKVIYREEVYSVFAPNSMAGRPWSITRSPSRGRINTWVTKESSVALRVDQWRCHNTAALRNGHACWDACHVRIIRFEVFSCARTGIAMTINGPFFKYGVSARVKLTLNNWIKNLYRNNILSSIYE